MSLKTVLAKTSRSEWYCHSMYLYVQNISGTRDALHSVLYHDVVVVVEWQNHKMQLYNTSFCSKSLKWRSLKWHLFSTASTVNNVKQNVSKHPPVTPSPLLYSLRRRPPPPHPLLSEPHLFICSMWPFLLTKSRRILKRQNIENWWLQIINTFSCRLWNKEDSGGGIGCYVTAFFEVP